MIEIVQTPPFNTVQDLGRPGYRKIGVTASGAMDPLGLKIGNILVGNEENAAAIEIQLFSFRIRFTSRTVFAVTGVDCEALIDGETVLPWCAQAAEPGQLLELRQPQAGARAYLCVGGGIDVEPVLGSRSTSLRGAFGGHEGRSLCAGDVLRIGTHAGIDLPPNGLAVVDPTFALADIFPGSCDGSFALRAVPAGEYDLFGAEAERFWDQSWKISSQSDRTGYRLAGNPLKLATPVELRSHGIVPGVVQMPPSGQPIIQMSDANTAGGYPKIAGIFEADLWRLGQAPIGSRIRFVQGTHREALDVERATARFLDDVRDTSRRVRNALKAMA